MQAQTQIQTLTQPHAHRGGNCIRTFRPAPLVSSHLASCRVRFSVRLALQIQILFAGESTTMSRWQLCVNCSAPLSTSQAALLHCHRHLAPPRAALKRLILSNMLKLFLAVTLILLDLFHFDLAAAPTAADCEFIFMPCTYGL